MLVVCDEAGPPLSDLTGLTNVRIGLGNFLLVTEPDAPAATDDDDEDDEVVVVMMLRGRRARSPPPLDGVDIIGWLMTGEVLLLNVKGMP